MKIILTGIIIFAIIITLALTTIQIKIRNYERKKLEENLNKYIDSLDNTINKIYERKRKS
tara:strand:- start:724 stop:903 length:180 start_codon:yes stop_codon:yes gene_type:complete